MIEPLVELRQTLRAYRQSLTTARQIIFEALLDQEPQTMRELVLACRGRVDRASIYRTVALYERLGIIQRLQIGWKYKLELSDAFSHHHHHLTCSSCGRVIPLPEDAELENRLLGLAEGLRFTPHDHQIEIRGHCVDCQA